MPSPEPSPQPPPDVVTRLRAAGCVFAEAEARLLASAARTPAELGEMVERRAGGVPIEHVVGWAQFCGLRLSVAPGVFVPRHRTEFLVDQVEALARAAGHAADHAAGEAAGRPDTVLLDLCCGSGAVGAALLARLPSVRLCAVDIDPVAVACAQRNLGRAGGRAYQGDLYDPLPGTLLGRVTVVVASTPYVPTDEIRLMPPEARLHEPRPALDGGADGLDVVRRVFDGAPPWLVPAGHVAVETSERQAATAADIAERHGFIPRVARSAETDGTVVIGTRP